MCLGMGMEVEEYGMENGSHRVSTQSRATRGGSPPFTPNTSTQQLLRAPPTTRVLDGVRLCSWHMTAYSATTLVATVALGALLGALQPRVGAALMTGFVALCTYGAVQPALLLILGGLLAQTLSSPTVRAPPAPSNARCPRC